MFKCMLHMALLKYELSAVWNTRPNLIQGRIQYRHTVVRNKLSFE